MQTALCAAKQNYEPILTNFLLPCFHLDPQWWLDPVVASNISVILMHGSRPSYLQHNHILMVILRVPDIIVGMLGQSQVVVEK